MRGSGGFGRYPSTGTETYYVGFGSAANDKAGRILETSTIACWRISSVILVILALTFTICRIVAVQLQARPSASAAAEAWLEQGQPRWNLTAISEPPEKFFLDFGSSAESLRMARRSRHLEKKGWSGICSVPLPGDLSDRTCKLLVLPVAGEDREEVTVPDCSGTSALGVTELARELMGSSTCPQVKLPAVGIATLLEQVDAPRVIDFVSLEMGSTALSILNHFPWESHCVRAWTINNPGVIDGASLRNLFEVSHGCRIREGGGEVWARCPCKDGAQAQPGVQPFGSTGFLSNAE